MAFKTSSNMKNTAIIRTISISLVVLALGSSCNDYLEEENVSGVIDGNFWQTESDFQNALVGAYANLNDYYLNQDFLMVTELSTETLTTRRAGDARADLDLYQWNPATEGLDGLYSNMYDVINNANNIINREEILQGITTVEATEALIGQALFLRALNYFNLVSFFGGVPIRLEQVGIDEVFRDRNSAVEVYQLVISDLERASQLLEGKELGLGRATDGATQSLLARVYLQKAYSEAQGEGDFQQAYEYAKRVIDQGAYRLVDLETLWGLGHAAFEGNEEEIFSVKADGSVVSARNLQQNFSPDFYPNRVGSDATNFHAEVPFYLSYDSADLRRTVYFMTEYVDNSGTLRTLSLDDPAADNFSDQADGPALAKYIDPNATGGFSAIDFRVIRYADVLLMAAEALNEINQGPTAEAVDYVNQVRERARAEEPALPPLAMDLSYQEFREALYTERRFELVGEGLGWFDGRRFWDTFTERIQLSSQDTTVRGTGKPQQVIGEIDDFRKLLPVPLQVINNGGSNEQGEANIQQNEGY